MTIVGVIASVLYGVLPIASARRRSGSPAEYGPLFLAFLLAGCLGGAVGGILHPFAKRSPLHRWFAWAVTLLPFMFVQVRDFVGVASSWKIIVLAVSFSVIAAAIVPLMSGSIYPQKKDWG